MRKLPKKILAQVTYTYPGDKFVKRPKYSNHSTSCWANHKHDSMLEADYCNELFLEKKSGLIKDYEIQHCIEIIVNNRLICKHYVDFFVKTKTGGNEFHETKGYDTETWRLKKKLVEALFPETPYIVKREKRLWAR